MGGIDGLCEHTELESNHLLQPKALLQSRNPRPDCNQLGLPHEIIMSCP